ncbi:unnamed protein product, partial [marine sediment metagenome]
WNFLDKLDELIIWLIVIIFIGTISVIGLITIIKWIVRLF